MRRVPTHIPALLCAAGCLTAAMPALAQQAAPVRSGQTMGMRYLSWSGKPTLVARPIVEAAPAPAVAEISPPAVEAPAADPVPMRAALPESDPFDAPPPRRTGPIIPRRPIMTMSAAVPAPPSPAVQPAASQGLTPASTWLDAAPATESGPRPYAATAYAAPYAEGTVTPYVNLAPADAEPVPPAYEPPVPVAPALELPIPPAAYEPPPAYEAPVVEAPAAVEPAAPPPPEPVPDAAPLDPPAPAVDPMAPRPDAPVFRMNRDAPSAPEPAMEPSAEPAPEAEPAAEPASPAAAPVDPMAPRPDAPVFRLRPQPSPAATDHPASEGARYYSVHRLAGHEPDPTPLPPGVFLDSLPVDLAEPPPPPAVTRDRDGRVRAIVPNEDPSLP